MIKICELALYSTICFFLLVNINTKANYLEDYESVSFIIADLLKKGSGQQASETTAGLEIYYQVLIGNKSLTVELTPNENFIDKNAIIQYINDEMDWPKSASINDANSKEGNNLSRCFMQGRVRDYEGSFAALSVCDGLVNYEDFSVLQL
jgi:hypothetical protein